MRPTTLASRFVGFPTSSGGAPSAILSRALDTAASPRVLVQYVPHAFGWKGGNLPFCLWLWNRKDRRPWVMFHEVAFPFDRWRPHEAACARGRQPRDGAPRQPGRAPCVRLDSRLAPRRRIVGGGRHVRSSGCRCRATVPVVGDDARVRGHCGGATAPTGRSSATLAPTARHLRAQLHACLPLLAKQCDCSAPLDWTPQRGDGDASWSRITRSSPGACTRPGRCPTRSLSSPSAPAT